MRTISDSGIDSNVKRRIISDQACPICVQYGSDYERYYLWQLGVVEWHEMNISDANRLVVLKHIKHLRSTFLWPKGPFPTLEQIKRILPTKFNEATPDERFEAYNKVKEANKL
jgi:hypothetical protein